MFSVRRAVFHGCGLAKLSCEDSPIGRFRFEDLEKNGQEAKLVFTEEPNVVECPHEEISGLHEPAVILRWPEKRNNMKNYIIEYNCVFSIVYVLSFMSFQMFCGVENSRALANSKRTFFISCCVK